MRYAVIIRWQWDKRRERRRQQRRRYFIKQRLIGIALLVLTMLAVKLLDGDATIALITVPLGLYLIFTGEMVIVDRFYRDTKERDIRNGTDIRAFRRDR